MKKFVEYEYTLWIGQGRAVIETMNPDLPTISFIKNEEDNQYQVLVQPREIPAIDTVDFEYYIEELEDVNEAAKRFEHILNN